MRLKWNGEGDNEAYQERGLRGEVKEECGRGGIFGGEWISG